MNKEINNQIKTMSNVTGVPTLNYMYEVRNLFITKIWHNVLNSTPKMINNCNRMTELNLIPCFDGLEIESIVNDPTAEMIFKFLQPFLYKGKSDDINSKDKHELLLDYMTIGKLAILHGVIDSDSKYPTKMAYKSSIVKDNELNITKASGDTMNMVQNATINFERKDDKWRIGVWVNPNKFIRSGMLQEHEPLLWFIKQVIYPKLIKPKISQLHFNIDIGVNYKNVSIYDNDRDEWSHGKYKDTAYLNNILKNSNAFFDTYNTLAVYDKTSEIGNKASNSYINKLELDKLKINDIGVTRLELRTYNAEQSKIMLNNYTFINNRYSLFVYYRDDKGFKKRKMLKDSLNKAYKHAKEIATDFTLVTEEILSNTYKV